MVKRIGIDLLESLARDMSKQIDEHVRERLWKSQLITDPTLKCEHNNDPKTCLYCKYASP